MTNTHGIVIRRQPKGKKWSKNSFYVFSTSRDVVWEQAVEMNRWLTEQYGAGTMAIVATPAGRAMDEIIYCEKYRKTVKQHRWFIRLGYTGNDFHVFLAKRKMARKFAEVFSARKPAPRKKSTISRRPGTRRSKKSSGR